ncbi:hypothetical protein [Paenibacillus ginsengarvi]|uniref:Nucleotide-diphospho-sugar transferase domain-containing protein n=1 Tax=Paenibacillus ginsengarvi TaxID=400777 RepID=A0A3B0CLC1_9BACL|nr:hypothetical protein [Paenibacillus ginsengarvi]RKN85324.1 hypothetical protein D7M11_09580 [Paenibacillus ginsengarvi]
MKKSTNIPVLPIQWQRRERTLLCSLATGSEHMEMLDLMAPTAAYYAGLHRMDCLMLPLPDIRLAPGRPPAWDKIILIHHMLKQYETVIWIDADAIICDPKKDIRSVLDRNIPMHMVAHRIGSRLIPNTGVWICRSLPKTFEMLHRIWNDARYVEHRWWEQAALMDLIGFDPDSITFRAVTPYTQHVQFIDREWNSRQGDSAPHPIIYHYCSRPKPIEDMYRRYDEFMQSVL